MIIKSHTILEHNFKTHTMTPLYTLKKIQSDFPQVKIKTSTDAALFIRKFYADDLEIFESVFILLLNTASQTIGYAKISQGGVSGSYVDIKIICKYAIDSLASGVILAHNHPSGNVMPSENDKVVTNKVKKALKTLDIELVDHLILTTSYYYSFGDESIL